MRVVPSSSPFVHREWPLLLVLAGVQFTHMMDFMVMMPLGPQFMRLFDISPQQFGLLVSAYTFSASVFGFAAVFYADRFDRKFWLLTLYAGFALATLLCALADSYVLLLTARAVAGAFGGAVGASVFAIVGDAVPEVRRGAAMGTVMSAFSLAAIAGVPTGLYLAAQFGWRAPFLLLTALSVAILLVAARVLPRVDGHLAHAHERHAWRHLRKILANGTHLNAFALIVTLMFAGFSVIPFISPYLVANVGLREADLAYLYFAGGLATLFTARLIGRLADRHGKPEVFMLVAALSIVPILVMTHLPALPLALALVVMTVFMVFVSGRMVPAIALITTAVEPRLRGSFMSLNSAVQQMSAGFAAIGAGAIIGQSNTGALTHYGLVGALAAGATVLAILLARRLGRAVRQGG